MAGVFKLVHSQAFTNTDIIQVVHNSAHEYLRVKVMLNNIHRFDLIKNVYTDKNDPTNILTVELVSSQTGIIQLFDADYICAGEQTASNLHITSDAVVDYVDVVSGTLQTSINEKPDTLLELIDTPSTYEAAAKKYLRIKEDETGIEWDTVSGISSHGQLTELTNDDHIQYVPTNADRGFTSTVSGIEPLEDYHLTTKQYVDSLIDPTVSGSVGNILFGSEFSYEEDDTTSSTNSIAWQDKLTLTADDLIEGSYRLGFYFLWDHSKSNTEFGAQVIVDNVSIIFEQDTRTARSGYYDLTSGFYYYENVVSGTHFATIKYKSSDTGSTSYIKQARLEFWRVS